MTPALYVDFRAAGLRITDNTFLDSDTGLLLHAAKDNVVARNTFYDIATYPIRIYDRFSYVSSGNRITDNRLFSKLPTSVIVRQVTSASTPNLNIHDNNRFSAIYAENTDSQEVVSRRLISGQLVTTEELSLAQWQQDGNDVNSTTFDLFHVLPYTYESLGLPNLLSDGGFETGFSAWAVYSSNADATITQGSACSSGNGCLHLQAGGSSSFGSAITPIFTVAPSKAYRVSFDIRTSLPDQRFRAIPRLAGPASYAFLCCPP